MSVYEGQHKRLQTALAANGLDTGGNMQQCLDRLLSASSNPKKRKAQHAPATTTAASAAILTNVKDKIEQLPSSTLADLEKSFGIRAASSSPKRRALKLAEHLGS